MMGPSVLGIFYFLIGPLVTQVCLLCENPLKNTVRINMLISVYLPYIKEAERQTISN